MKMYKLMVTGNDSSFSVDYSFTTNFVSYSSFGFTGSEQEKYDSFLADLKIHGGPQPINIKVKMTTSSTDRALSKNEVLTITDVNDFIKRLTK